MNFAYCSGPMKYETAVIPAKVTKGNAEPGIQCQRGFAAWTPAFAEVTTSYVSGPTQ